MRNLLLHGNRVKEQGGRLRAGRCGRKLFVCNDCSHIVLSLRYQYRIYSLPASPSGRRRPVRGCRNHPWGSPSPSHAVSAPTAAAGLSYHQVSSMTYLSPT